MCGITGIAFSNAEKLSDLISAMTQTLYLRGPDDSGIWADEAQGVAFGHRRLSVLDLSAAGHQPMKSKSGRFVITYNGEIYNYLEIRNQLLQMGVVFFSHSDTEVVLASFEEWGIARSLKLFNGMFAFAVWDNKEKKIYLARDRFGEKPLYYGWIDGRAFIFGSELKALREYKSWKPNINRDVLGMYLQYNHIPAPHTIYKNVFKVLPGSYLEITFDRKIKQEFFWDTEMLAKESSEKNLLYISSEEEIINQLHSCLSKSVQEKMISDVPLGAFLSGGVDSSLITALMKEKSNKPIKTFTIGFYEKYFNNEAPYAKQIAQYLCTDHTEFYLSNQDALDIIPKLPYLYDEPFADSSQLPTHMVSMLARKYVTVCLSGDGGDELFCGYNRYIWFDKIYKKFHRMPHLFWKLLTLLNEQQWDFINVALSKMLPTKLQANAIGNKIYKAARAFYNTNNAESFYWNLVAIMDDPSFFLMNNSELSINKVSSNTKWKNNNDFLHWMMLSDISSLFSGDMLTKIDRAAMGVSLETRIPFLDPEVFSFAWSLPLKYKIRHGEGKYILRQLLYKYVPRELLDRPKVGFGVPIAIWLRCPLRAWAESLLNEKRVRGEGFFKADTIKKYWNLHLSGKRDFSAQLWCILMFQAWLEVWG